MRKRRSGSGQRPCAGYPGYGSSPLGLRPCKARPAPQPIAGGGARPSMLVEAAGGGGGRHLIEGLRSYVGKYYNGFGSTENDGRRKK
ncbi:unnamed protein product [Coccothraustes coccothraustes]